ncbi:MAG: hypothetical protein R3C53_17630 [Pirellulaceae bacterium]
MRSHSLLYMVLALVSSLATDAHSQQRVTTPQLSEKELAAELQEATDLMHKFANSNSEEELTKLTRELIAPKEICEKVFTKEMASTLAEAYREAYDKGDLVIAGKPGQTVVKLTAASTDDLIGWTGSAAEHLAGGWKRMGKFVHPGYRIYTIKFLKPGEELGMRFDGLTKVDGKWYIFPKAWRLAPEG